MTFKRFLSGFRRDQRGATAVMFGVAAVPVALSMAATVDYARVVNYRTHMQAGVDSAALYLARQPATLSDPQLQAAGRPVFDAHNAAAGGYATAAFTATRSGKTIRVAATGVVDLAFAGLIGQPSVDIRAAAEVASGAKKIELALVLDNTGSMASRQKMDKLKEAANLLLDKLQAAATSPDDVKVSIVPFDTQARMPTATVSAPPFWIKFDPADPASGGARAVNWNGCVTDRARAANYDATDATPLISIRDSLYLAAQCDNATLARVLPLTNDFPAMRATIAAMRPSGCTNVTIGAAWGLATLSETEPLPAAAPLGDPDVQKIVVLLTDGLNTKNRWVESGGCAGHGGPSQIDARTQVACDSILNAATPQARIRSYAIRVIEGNETLLRGCAGNGGRYYDVQDPSELSAVFQAIADEITRIRLTS